MQIFKCLKTLKHPKNDSFSRFFESDRGRARTLISCGIAGDMGASRTREFARKISNFYANSLEIKKNRLKAQNLVEFVFIFPLLILLTLIIFEVAFFWQEVNAIYNLNAEINANVALKYTTDTNLNFGDECPAAAYAQEFLTKRASMISLTNPTFTKTILYSDKEPFALYKYSANNITVGGETKPQITLWVDCRNPYEDGISTQIEFYHKTMLLKATLPNLSGGAPIVIIPDNIFIASPKLNTLRHY